MVFEGRVAVSSDEASRGGYNWTSLPLGQGGRQLYELGIFDLSEAGEMVSDLFWRNIPAALELIVSEVYPPHE